MKKKSFLIVLLLLAFGVLFTACNDEKVTPSLSVESSFTTVVGEKVTLTPKIGGTEEQLVVKYASNNEKVATVDNGTVTTVDAGEAKITVSLEKYPDVKAIVNVKVIEKVIEKVLDDFAPTTITVTGDATIALGKTSQFTAELAPAGAHANLFWETSNPEVAVVGLDGVVTAVNYGTATITAKSAIKDTVKGEFEVKVVQEGTNEDVIEAVLAYVKNQMPEYVTEDFDFPTYPNPDVTLIWATADEETITDGKYRVDPDATKSYKDIINVDVQYNGYASNFTPINLKVVVGENDFKVIDEVQEFLRLYFGQSNNKITKNVDLITKYKGATISWSSTRTDVISTAGEFKRPNDDTQVTLKPTINSNSIDVLDFIDVTAVGYTAEEKMDYILNEGVLKGFDGKESNMNILLPVYDTKFGIDLSYESKNTAVFDHDGKYMNIDLAEDTDVVFTVTFTYTKEGFAFTETKDITLTALKATDTSKAAFTFLESGVEVPTYFPYGVPDREGGNTINLPTTVEGFDGVTIEWAGNEEDFDGLTLKTQYLRYHDAVLTATFKKAEVEDVVLQFALNTGIAKERDTVYVGGRFSERKDFDTTELQYQYDLLNTFSYFDKAVGVTEYKDQQRWSFYSGYTYSVKGNYNEDGTFEYSENGRTFTYYAMDFVTVYITDVKEDGTPVFDVANANSGTGGNWALFFVNLTDKVAKIPLATHGSGQGTDGLDWVTKGSRENALTFDGFRAGFTANQDGTVVMGAGNKVIQTVLETTTTHIDVPANGYGMTFKSQENKPDIVSLFANPGAKLAIEKFDLAPENDYRVRRFNTALNNAKSGIEALEAGETTEINIDSNLKNAKAYKNNYRLTAAELANFDVELYNNLIQRRAVVLDAEIQKVKDSIDTLTEEEYLQDLQAAYDKLPSYMQEVKDLMNMDEWLLAEYDAKLAAKYNVSFQLNGGQLYANTKAEISDLFLTELHTYLSTAGFNEWVSTKKVGEDIIDVNHTLPSLEEFKNPNSTNPDSFHMLMKGDNENYDVTGEMKNTDHFLRIWLFEFWAVDNDHLTIDETGVDKHFLRQPEYNKWVEYFLLINETLAAGGTGREVLGRIGEQNLIKYIPDSKVWGKDYNWSTVTVSDTTGSFRQVAQYVFDLPLATRDDCRNLFVKDYYLYDVEVSQAKIDALGQTYTAGTPAIVTPEAVKTGFTLEGWYLDEGLTQKATLTPEGLGKADAVLYAKWVEDTPVEG